MQTSNFKHYIHLHFLVFIAGFTAILGELISVSSISLVWHRMLIASVLTLIYLIASKTKISIDFKTLLKFSLPGLIIALHWITFFEAIEQSNISITLAMFSTAAFFTSFIEPLFFRRRIIYYEIVMGLLVITGVYLITMAEILYLNGIILGIFSALFSSLFSVFNGKLVKKYSPITISFYEFLTGVIFITSYLLITKSFSSVYIENIFSLDYFYLFILGSVCTAYAFIAAVSLMKYLTPFTVVLTYNLEPVYGIVLAILLFPNQEKMSFMFYLGAILILATIIINSFIKYRKN
jgi:drug/metabolite transporter (DMT)-like permease